MFKKNTHINNHYYNNLNIIILFIPFLFSFLWHIQNTQVPVSDAIGWLDAASNILKPMWIDEDILGTLYEFFSERSWRPVIFHLFVTPFLFLTDGDFVLATGITHAIFVLLSTIIIYKIFRLNFDKFESSISSAIISLSTNIMFGGIGLPLFAELAFTPFYLCTIYFLITSDFFTIKRNSLYFALFFFLLFATRPVEGLIYIALPLTYFLFKGVKNNYLDYKNVIKCLLISFFTLSLLCVSRFIPEISKKIVNLDPPVSGEFFTYFSFAVFTLTIILTIIYISSKKEKLSTLGSEKKSYLLYAFYLQSILIFIWWYPYFSSLFEWVYMTSFGAVVSYYRDSDIYWLIPWAFKSSGLYLFSVVSFIFFLYFLTEIIVKKYLKIKIYEQCLLLLLSIPLPWLIYLFSVQGFYRKVSLSMVCALICLFYYILSRKKFKITTNIFLPALLVIQIYSVYTHTFINFKNDKFWSTEKKNTFASNFIGIEYPLPINVNPNPHDLVVNQLDLFNKKYNLYNIALTVDETGEPVDAFLINLLLKKYKFNSNIPYITSIEFLEDKFDLFNKYDSFFLINPKGLKMIKSKENAIKAYDLAHDKFKSPSARFAYYLQYLYSSEKLAEKGFTVLECKDISKLYKGCLIVRSNSL